MKRFFIWLTLSTLAVSMPSPPAVTFRDLAATAGISFVLENSPTAQKRMIETMPGGLAVFDFNGDGKPDLYFTNGAPIPGLEKTGARYANHLYRNDGNMRYTDVTSEAGVAGRGYGMGAAAADYDNDGHPDLFVAGVNHNTLYRNNGHGGFDDVTGKAGIADDGQWAVAAGWFDYDNDGKLDLFVVHYAKFSVDDSRFCGDSVKQIRVYCHPKYFEPLPATLYRNRGDGTFEDVSKKSGIAAHAGRGMSVAFADYDHDGRIDAFVTNDNMPNFLFHNQGNGTFKESALETGVALLDHGKPVASMGADFRDYDNDGWPDLVVTALAGETFPLFRNQGKGQFMDATYLTGVGRISTRRSGWGNGLADFNNDGWKDLFTANAHVNDRVELFEPHQYKEPNSIMLNAGNGKFEDGTERAGEAFQKSVKAHRGSAIADFDGDGKLDVVVSVLGERAELWQNTTAEAGNWIRFHLVGTRSNRDGIGARIRVGKQWNEMTSSVSYASSSLTDVHFGLGKQQTVDEVEVIWPSGTVQHLKGLNANQTVTVKEP